MFTKASRFFLPKVQKAIRHILFREISELEAMWRTAGLPDGALNLLAERILKRWSLEKIQLRDFK